MYVSVLHTIKDPASFHTRGLQLRDGGPDGVALVQFLPAVEGQRATCLWAGGSVDAVREFIDGRLGDASDQEYFPVADEQAFGLPATARS